MVSRPDNDAVSAARYLPLVVTIVLALGILGGTVAFAALYVRKNSREQITNQDARILYALWVSQKSEETENLSTSDERVSDELRSVYETARLPQLAGLLGTRLFDTNGTFVWADATVAASTLDEKELAAVRRLKPVARFRPAADLSEVNVALTAPVHAPLLEICIPLHSTKRTDLAGIAQFIMDGGNVAAEFKKLDRTLLLQAAVTFVSGGGLLVAVLGVGFQKLQRSNRLLSERTLGLLRANQELALAAKTSAVGTLTAHLIHGLKNPLSGLQNFVASRGQAQVDQSDSEWEIAVSSTRRMQNLISEIVRVLQEEDGNCQYELTLPEFGEMVAAKVQPLARQAGVHFHQHCSAEGVLRNREANLISLILYNLVQNGIQATAPGKSVALSLHNSGTKVSCEVKDEGTGMSPEQRSSLFQPCRSGKEGGSGIGLAISKQLANCIGAQLELQRSDASGSVFVLTFDGRDTESEKALAVPKPVG